MVSWEMHSKCFYFIFSQLYLTCIEKDVFLIKIHRSLHQVTPHPPPMLPYIFQPLAFPWFLKHTSLMQGFF